MSNTQSETSQIHACYLLGFSPAKVILEPSESSMLAYFGVDHFVSGPIAVWYKQIERSEFEGPAAEKNLADLQWLTPRVLAHESVVSELSQRTAFYPSRFGCLFSTKDKLASLASESLPRLIEFFELVRSRSEWGLKLIGDNVRNAEIIAEQQGIARDGRATSGANYLKLRQLQREQTQASSNLFASALANALGVLHANHTHLVTRPLYNTGDNPSQQLLGNFAVLADSSQQRSLIAWAETWNAEQYTVSGTRLEITGPWPAYSFCPSLGASVSLKEAA